MLSSLSDLSFVTENQDGTFNHWNPPNPDSYVTGVQLGKGYAAELHGFIQETGNAVAFGAVMRAITAGGRYEAVEIGFCSHFGVVLSGVECGFDGYHGVGRTIAEAVIPDAA